MGQGDKYHPEETYSSPHSPTACSGAAHSVHLHYLHTHTHMYPFYFCPIWLCVFLMHYKTSFEGWLLVTSLQLVLGSGGLLTSILEFGGGITILLSQCLLLNCCDLFPILIFRAKLKRYQETDILLSFLFLNKCVYDTLHTEGLQGNKSHVLLLWIAISYGSASHD